MARDTEALIKNPLFLAVTRPALWAGIPIEEAVLLLIVCAIVLIEFNTPVYAAMVAAFGYALIDASDDLMSNRFVLGDHHFTLAIYGETQRTLRDHMAVARAALADTGMVAAREGAALEAAYWSQLVGNFAWRVTSFNNSQPMPSSLKSERIAIATSPRSRSASQASMAVAMISDTPPMKAMKFSVWW